MSDDQPFVGPVLRRDVPTQCTNWYAYGLTQIWQMLEPETGGQSWDQVLAWGRMQGLCEHQAQRLRQAMAQLEQVWPTGPSEAAQAFSSVVHSLAKSLDENAVAAHQNASALSDLTVGIGQTRQNISALVEERNRKNATYKITQPELDDLDNRARQIMKSADQIPARANIAFLVPPAMPEMIGVDERRPFNPDAATLNATPPTVITLPLPVFDPPESLPGISALLTVEPSGRIEPSPPPAADIGGPDQGAVGSPVLAGDRLDSLAHRSVDVRESGPSLIAPSSPPPSHLPRAGQSLPAPPTVVGPGGLIRPPQQSTFAGAPHGSQSTAGRSSAMPGGTMAPMLPPNRPVPSGTSAGIMRRRAQSDPYEQWGVPKSVPAVIEPSDEPTSHEPGPGVIGIDR